MPAEATAIDGKKFKKNKLILSVVVLILLIKTVGRMNRQGSSLFLDKTVFPLLPNDVVVGLGEGSRTATRRSLLFSSGLSPWQTIKISKGPDPLQMTQSE